MATPPPLLRLPPELILRISSFLNTPDLGKFRLSCKAVETNLFDSFAREFFSKRQFMVEEISLNALVGISRHRTLSPYLSEIIISLDTLLDAKFANSTCRSILLASGRARDLLVEAFSNLSNLRRVGLRDYDGKGRSRDGDDAMWKSYGWTFGGVDRRPYHTRSLPVPILPLLLCALGESSRKPENIEIFLRRARLPDSSFELGFMQPRLAPVLSGLKTLLLSLQDDSHHDIDHAYERLKEFLHHTPLLEHLRLNFMSHQRPTDAPGELLAWLGTSPSSSCPNNVSPPPIKLENLTTLDLGMLTVTPEVLLRVVNKFAELKSLSLWKVCLKGKARNVTDPNVSDLWSDFLPKLGHAFRAPQDVSMVMIGWTMEIVEDTAGITSMTQRVKFAGQVSSDDDGSDRGKKYNDAEDVVKFRQQVEGNNAREWLTGLGDRTCLPPEREFDDSDLDIDGSQESDDNDDDEDDEDESDDDV